MEEVAKRTRLIALINTGNYPPSKIKKVNRTKRTIQMETLPIRQRRTLVIRAETKTSVDAIKEVREARTMEKTIGRVKRQPISSRKNRTIKMKKRIVTNSRSQVMKRVVKRNKRGMVRQRVFMGKLCIILTKAHAQF